MSGDLVTVARQHLPHIGALPRARTGQDHAAVLGEHGEQALDRQRAMSGRTVALLVEDCAATGDASLRAPRKPRPDTGSSSAHLFPAEPSDQR
jgi:hypothetical protein